VSSFDEVSQEWLIKFLNHRIGDPRMIRLIQKWLKAGVLEEVPSRLVWKLAERRVSSGVIVG